MGIDTAGSDARYRPLVRSFEDGCFRAFALGAGGLMVGLMMPEPLFGQAALSCIHIDEIRVVDAPLLDENVIAGIVEPYEGRCLGLEDFNTVMSGLTDAYIEDGYITSRVYLPEQDLADGTLEIAAVEGKITDILINGHEEESWQKLVMPGIEGKVANIRDIEQGLDNIKEMETYEVDMQIEAGEKFGQSVLLITAKQERPWLLNFTTSNSSEEPVGEFSSTLDLTIDNPLRRNDIWNLSYTKSQSSTPFFFGDDGDSSQSLSLGLTVPYGYWRHKVDFDWSNYISHIDGALSPIEVSGWTEGWSYELRKLTFRDQYRKSYVTFTLGTKESANYILDTRLDGSSRKTSRARLEYSTSYPVGEEKDANISWKFGVEKGLPFFGAELYRDQPEGTPSAQYLLIDGSLDYSKKSEKAAYNLIYAVSAKAQLSLDHLYSDQQFTLGGSSTIRGSLSSLAMGNSGLFVRQDWSFEYPNEKFGTFVPLFYVGIDTGVIARQSKYDVESFAGLGGIVGLKLKSNRGEFDLGLAQVLASSDGGRFEPRLSWTFTHRF